MTETENPVQAHQFHVLLRAINPPIWRRLIVRSNRSVADLHRSLQIAFRWGDFHLHMFLIRGVDESGVNLALTRLYGRAPRGERAVGARTQRALESAVKRVMLTVTESDAAAWFAHCGYQLN